MKELKISLIWILVWSIHAWAFSAVPSHTVAIDQFRSAGHAESPVNRAQKEIFVTSSTGAAIRKSNRRQ
jgi:hypothetical protein